MADDDPAEGLVDVGGRASLDGGGSVAPSVWGAVVAPLDGVAPAEGRNDPGRPTGINGGGEAVVAVFPELGVVLQQLHLLEDGQQVIVDRLVILEHARPQQA